MSRIIQVPVGKPVKRIQVDVDIQGQVQVTGTVKGALGQTVPMSMFDVSTVLANVVASSLLAMGGAIPLNTKQPSIKVHEFKIREDGADICILCGEGAVALCHTRGNSEGNGDATSRS